METSQLICKANQLTGFYVMGGTLVLNGSSRQESYYAEVYSDPKNIYDGAFCENI